jgi:hypothetical protein
MSLPLLVKKKAKVVSFLIFIAIIVNEEYHIIPKYMFKVQGHWVRKGKEEQEERNSQDTGNVQEQQQVATSDVPRQLIPPNTPAADSKLRSPTARGLLGPPPKSPDSPTNINVQPPVQMSPAGRTVQAAGQGLSSYEKNKKEASAGSSGNVQQINLKSQSRTAEQRQFLPDERIVFNSVQYPSKSKQKTVSAAGRKAVDTTVAAGHLSSLKTSHTEGGKIVFGSIPDHPQKSKEKWAYEKKKIDFTPVKKIDPTLAGILTSQPRDHRVEVDAQGRVFIVDQPWIGDWDRRTQTRRYKILAPAFRMRVHSWNEESRRVYGRICSPSDPNADDEHQQLSTLSPSQRTWVRDKSKDYFFSDYII